MGMFVVAPAGYDSSFTVDVGINGGNNATTTALGVGVGVIPLLTPGQYLNMAGGGGGETVSMEGNDSYTGRNRAGALQFWQAQQQIGGSGYPKKSINFDPGDPNPLGCSGGGATTCQDCGNQAKKDCSHRRCRTCCKSRGFDCSTHVKSTWVSAGRRRERQMIAAAPGTIAGTHGGGGGGGGGASSGSTSGAKKPRFVSSQNTSPTSNSNTPPRSFETSSSHQDASLKESLPGQVRAPAVFKCVRVTAVDEEEDQFAYQAVVKIGGHVFKGFLYDQGDDEPRDGSFPNLSELHLGGGAATSSGGGGRNGGGSTSSPLLDPSDVYGASSGGCLLGGSSYGNTIN